ncbi:MAG: CehA/McbA family metallohydrolase [Clostridiales bacterium]|nr:CehA/McbA family metallohydrolase [Clostridiales bacterium]
MNKRGLSRMLSVLLLVVMVVSMLPVSAYAEGATAALVTDLSSLAAGDKVVIVAKDYDFALGTTQNKNNREAVAVTKAGSNITVTETVQVLTLGAGTKEGTVAFNTGSGYLYAASSDKNYLRTESELSDNSSWTVEISADGTATLKAQGTNTRNWMRFNSSNNPKLFSCYGSGQADICIYKVGAGTAEPDPTPTPVVETVATPTASPAAGEVDKGTQVSFSCETEGAAIVYKTTGDYEAYTGPIAVNEDTTFTVKATKEGMNDSAEATFAYTVKAEETEKPWKDVEAKYSIYELVDAPQDGDTVLIFNPNSGNAVTAIDPKGNARNLSGDAETPTNGYIAIDAADVAGKAAEWTVSAGSDGTYSFAQGEKKLSANGSEKTFNLCTDAAGSAKWTLSDSVAANKTHYIASSDLTGTYGNVYVEWFSGVSAFTVYCTSTDRLNENAFGFAFYKLVREGVPEATPEYDTIAEALAGAEGTSFTVKGVVTLVDSKNIYIQDETGGICAFMTTKPTDISLGDTLVATGTRASYKGLPELSGATYEKSSGLTLKAKPTTIGALTTADVCTYVQLTGLEITEVYDKDGTFTTPNITVKDAEGNSIQLYKAIINKDTEGNWEYAVGDKIDVKAAVGVNNTTLQLRNTLATEIKPHVEQENHIVTDLSELTDGAKVVIFNPANMKALSQTYDGYYNTGVDVTNTDGKLAGYGATEIWTVGVNADGSYTFSTADGKKFSMGASYTSTPLDDVNPDWKILPAATADCFYIQNAVRGNYIEWYASKSNWSSYGSIGSNEALFAQQFYLVVKEEEQPAEGGLPEAGDQVVIYNVSAEGVLAGQDDNTDSPSITGVGAEIADGKAVPENGARVFTVEKNGDYFRFYNEHDGYLCSNGTGNNAFYSKDATDDADWTLAARDGGFTMESRTAKYNGKYSQYLEYYADSYKTYSMYNVTDYSIYTFHFYPVGEAVNVTEGIVNAPQVVFGSMQEAYIGQEYSFSFTIDAVFGLDGEPAVKLGETALTPALENGIYTVTVPVEQVTGDKLTVTVSGKDTKGVAFSGSADITVLDEPVFSDLTPTAGSQTGEDKTPVISVKVANAGEDPTITMTLNGEAVTPTYEDGVISYQAAEAMPDGRVNVTITVKRADGKEASKSWAFTVGTAQYQLYFGQLHSHTTYSDGSGTLETALAYVAGLPDSANVDFVAFTDHSNYFDKSGDANPEGALYDMSLATAYSQETWKSYKDAVAAFNASQSDVVAIAGFEMTWSGGPGHINTFNTPGIVSRNNTTLNNKTDDAGMKAYYALLSQPEGVDSLSQFNHPGSTFGTFADFSYYDALIDSRIFLVEVGNGEGQIGAGGYYPSYEYYTMALDKGWHVAPTNNQDNHKGKWGNANDARDVIITDDFSEQGIYDAIRAMRMYATEDKNLEISYTLNDMMMGTIISEVPEKLNISVTVNDPDVSDSISKVEVIVNSGKTAYTWNDPAELATGALSVELAPDYSYYYIRVTEGDGDLAVTAPVWVGESLKLGISSLECGTSTPVTGEELTLTTTFFNSEAADATIKSLTYTTDGSVVLDTDTTGYTVPASGTLAVDFKYTPDVAKVMTVTVTAVVELDGKEFTFTKDISLDILDANSLVYVGIDASHYNEYVAGNYSDSMGNFGALAAEYSVRTVELKTSEELIAACSNPKFAMLVFTAPSRRDGSALRDPYATYSDAEIEAITEFNSKGGAVVLCGWGDYYESYAEFPAEDHMAAQQNKILAALGSFLRISDDETKDDTWNGGQAQRLYLSSYNFDSFLLSGVEYDAENPHNNLYTELYSQYGGASIYTEGGTVPATVTPVVYGFDTTYSSDDDKDSYGGLGSIPKYTFDGAERLMVMATEELPGKGLIVVSGAAFLSNFEVQATVSDNGSEKNYSNYKICQNLLKYVNPVTVTDIATVRAQTETGYKYTIEGIVTSNASGYDKDTAFFDCIYVQDATGGICCFPVAGNYKVGDKVRITGTTDFFQGEPELQVSSIEVIGSGEIAPTEVTAKEIVNRSAEGKLITLKGVVVSFEEANGLVQTIMVRDEAGDVARVFIDGYITIGHEVENLALGAEVTVTGLASYDDTFNAPEGPFPRIRIRDRADVVCGEVVEHIHEYTWTTTKEATCTEDGLKTGVCSCTDTVTEVIPATGHKFGEWTTTKKATCTEDGREARICANCGLTETRAIKATGHKFGEWKVVKAPTDYLSGKEERVCSICGEKETRKIPSLKGVESGDNSNILLWIVTLTVSGTGAAVILAKSRKKYKGMH